MNPFGIDDDEIDVLFTEVYVPPEHLDAVLKALKVRVSSMSPSYSAQIDALDRKLQREHWLAWADEDGGAQLVSEGHMANPKVLALLAPWLRDGSTLTGWDHASDMPVRRVIFGGKVVDQVGQVTWVQVCP